jgi:hypothetical protein
VSKLGKIFLFTAVVLIGVTLIGVSVLGIIEYQAREALPAAEQSAAVIESRYDGAVCLSCSIYGMVILIFGLMGTGVVVLCWVIYESIAAGQRKLSTKDR